MGLDRLKTIYSHTSADPYKVLQVRQLSKHCYSLRLERRDLSFKSGQCFNIGCVGEGVNREFSIYSGESEQHLDFLIKEVEGGAVSPKLKKLKAGDSVELAGPYGLFTLFQDDPLAHRYVFIGTGTGIAPFHSFSKTWSGLNYRVIHGVREADETYDSHAYPADRYTACVSRPQEQKHPHFQGRVTDYLRNNPIDTEALHYLCGNRAMINEVFDILTEAGVSGDRIFTEVFF